MNRDRLLTRWLPLIALAMISANCYTISPKQEKAFWALQSPPAPEDLYIGETTCRLHHVDTLEAHTVLSAGMCVQPRGVYHAYMKARVSRFPNSWWTVSSCSCLGPDSLAFVRVCPICREEERRWRRINRWPTKEAYPLKESASQALAE
jgi:hypothetical protein